MIAGGAIAGGGQILLVDIRLSGVLASGAFGENFVLREPGIRRDKNSKVFGNTILAGQNGLAGRLQDYGAFTTGALLAAYGIENDTRHPCGF